MMRRSVRICLTLLLVFCAGCDDFSLLERFRFMSLRPATNTLRPGEECGLDPEVSTEPYTLALVSGGTYDDGVHEEDLGSIAGKTYTAGNSIGSVIIRLTDGAGRSVDTPLSVVPWEPQGISASGEPGPPSEIHVDWTYDVPGYIEGFRLWRSKAEEAFEEIAALDATARTYLDTDAHPTMNVYRLYAVAGGVLSLSAEASGAGNP